MSATGFPALVAAATRVGERLKARHETVAVAESSAGGLLSAALLAVPGASAYYLGGTVVYTRRARKVVAAIPKEDVVGMRSASEPYAQLLARRSRERLAATWGVSETGASGPTGNAYGDAPGHTCVAVAGPIERSATLETGRTDRVGNMFEFAARALELLERALDDAPCSTR
ncbi:MAG: CinA family protein [Burkholderiaceae bacterium]